MDTPDTPDVIPDNPSAGPPPANVPGNVDNGNGNVSSTPSRLPITVAIVILVVILLAGVGVGIYFLVRKKKKKKKPVAPQPSQPIAGPVAPQPIAGPVAPKPPAPKPPAPKPPAPQPPPPAPPAPGPKPQPPAPIPGPKPPPPPPPQPTPSKPKPSKPPQPIPKKPSKPPKKPSKPPKKPKTDVIAAPPSSVQLPTGTVPAGTAMEIPKMERGGAWNISRINGGITSDGSQIKIVLKAGGAGSETGGAFHAVPKGLPARTATLSFSVYIPPDFETKKHGGKLPGLCVGTTAKGCATGGEWASDAGSLRFMYRQGGNGFVQAILYAYMPWSSGTNSDKGKSAWAAAGDAYKAVSAASKGSAGHDIFLNRKDPSKAVWKMKTGEWNNLSMTLTLPSSGSASDGSISGTVNAITRTIDGVRFGDNGNVRISNVDFVAFVGGSDGPDWNFDKPSYFLFKSLAFSAS